MSLQFTSVMIRELYLHGVAKPIIMQMHGLKTLVVIAVAGILALNALFVEDTANEGFWRLMNNGQEFGIFSIALKKKPHRKYRPIRGGFCLAKKACVLYEIRTLPHLFCLAMCHLRQGFPF